ncbi:hypothetical protein [Rhizobium leguminosarum]|uniref:hypothetical protein n=1 Tax=Rhizobium leguminosarum TaxID=384 RepID=UPI001FDFB47B|nr:hypothetical protein [Rhizobium leguminosarum]
MRRAASIAKRVAIALEWREADAGTTMVATPGIAAMVFAVHEPGPVVRKRTCRAPLASASSITARSSVPSPPSKTQTSQSRICERSETKQRGEVTKVGG